MDVSQFDRDLIASVFHEAGLVGWRDTTVLGAARAAGLDLAQARARFPNKRAVLLRFGRLADQAVLAQAASGGLPRERLFDVLMARFDQLQPHRPGVLALIQALRTDPALALLLWGATLRSMRWMLDACDIPTAGLAGTLRIHGLGAVWAYALRAWEKDDSTDLSATMAAVDKALDRAAQAATMRPFAPPRREPPRPEAPHPDPRSHPHPDPSSLSGSSIAAAEDGPAVI